MTTKEIEHIAYNHFWKKGVYLVYEVASPKTRKRETRHRERVDLLSFELPGTWKCYEIKTSVSDFHSSAKLSFWGDYNYFILDAAIYEKVKDDIPKGIGVWLVYNDKSMACVKRPIKMKRMYTHEQLLFAMTQALSREYKKYRKTLEKIINELC